MSGFEGLQFSVKTKRGSLLNITGKNPKELDENAIEMLKVIPNLLDLEGDLVDFEPESRTPVSGVNPASVTYTAPSTPSSRPIDSNGNPLPDWVKPCPHGVTQYRSGSNAKGTWHGYYCALGIKDEPQPGQPAKCERQFPR